MTGPLRRAGRGIDRSGAGVVWSVAEGRKGRRWREVRTATDGRVISSLLFETDPAGRFSHTELSTAAGLLTLHPEPDGTIHGNTVTADGVRHVVGLPWATDGIVLVEGSTITAAAAARLIATTPAANARAILRIGLDLGCRVGEGQPSEELDRVSADGLPDLADGADWPLETA